MEIKPSQLKNVFYHFLIACSIAVIIGISINTGRVGLWVTVIPVFMSLWRVIVTATTKYHISEESLVFKRGVVKRKIDDLRLYRVEDIRVEQPLGIRMFGLGNIIVMSSDKSTPVITIEAVFQSEEKMEMLARMVEKQRQIKGVRVIE